MVSVSILLIIERYFCIDFKTKLPSSEDMKYCHDAITDDITGEALWLYLSIATDD